METKSSIKPISPDALEAGRRQPFPPAIIDVLPRERYETVHVDGSLNACVFEVTFLDQVASLVADKNTPIVVYGAGADTLDALTAAEKLQRAGYRKVQILEGGMDAWLASGLPIVGQTGNAKEGQPIYDGDYTVDIEASRIEWAGRNPNTRHHGTVPLTKGRLTIREGLASGFFDVDMRLIRNINLENDPLRPVLEAHLKSDDFFFTSQFPTARYRMRKAVFLTGATDSAPNTRVSGDLLIRGVEAPLDLEATVTPGPDSRVLAEAHFDLDRTGWGVIYGSRRYFRYLGMHLVFDLISLQINIVARKR